MSQFKTEIYNNDLIPENNDAKNVQLNEIFVSIEGEGIFAGTKTLFIRFSGCHLKCHWCDTKYSLSFNSGNSYTIEDAKSLICQYIQPNIYKVNFTGGEPLLQSKSLISLANFVKSKLYLKTYLESSCFDWQRFKYVLPYIDICKIEFKISDSKVVKPELYDNLLDNELKCLDLSLNSVGKVPFIKIVFTNSTTVNEIQNLLLKIFDRPNINNLKGFTLQPSYQFDTPNPEKILKIYDEVCNFYKDVRVIPQMHKLLDMS
ncbi:MAG: 7-carboxy-7-deazaguanine synthase QueE [Nitrosopumilus sp.]|nr:7-carboxy-7-deazaguanine synthase QueE [Nitrosopumilus sp.]